MTVQLPSLSAQGPAEDIILKSELEALALLQGGSRLFAQNLEEIRDAESVLRILGRYVHFNGVFGGGVANLAGEIAVRRDLFRDPDEPIEIMADRSNEVGAAIFAAAVEEFDIWSTPYRGTHRSLALAMLKGAVNFFGHHKTVNQILQIDESTQTAIRQVLDGYAVNQVASEKKLFRALGFHLGSEILADQEFCILDEFLRSDHPHLVAHLQKMPLPTGNAPQGCYTWIAIHTKVEAEHFAFGLGGVNDALRYYAGTENRECVRQWVLDGFTEFGITQHEFVKNSCKNIQ